MILLLARNRTSYFRPYRDYFVSIYGAFLAFPVRELLMMFLPERVVYQVSTHVEIGAGVAIALIWGYLATKLYLYPAEFTLHSAFIKPSRPVHFIFILYTVPCISTLLASFVLPRAIEDTPVNATYLLSGVTSTAVGFSAEFLTVALSIVVAFVVYPFIVLVSLRSRLKDPEVRYALKVIALCFGIISVLILTQNALDTFGVSITGLANLVSVSLLVIVDRAFSRPSFLKAFLGVVPSIQSRYTSKRVGMKVLIYGKDEEKFGPIARFVSEGVNQEGLVVYFYRGDETVVREALARHGFNIRQHLMKRSLRLVPFSSLYRSDESLDEDSALAYVGELVEEALTLGKNSLRLVVDYGEQAQKLYKKFVDHLTDQRWTNPSHYVVALMIFSKSTFQGDETALSLLKSKVDTIDLSDLVDSFSRTIGLSHSEIAGKKILIEYEPLSDYERTLRSLLAESSSNFERSVLFTRRDSPVYSLVGKQAEAKIFVITSRVSYPRLEQDNRVLLPAYDSSLLLDALNKTIQAYAGASFTIIFDSISHYIFTLGHERALSLVRQAMELMISDKVTLVFLLNMGAHDQKTISIFENLFDMELVCSAGARIPQVKRRLNVEVGR